MKSINRFLSYISIIALLTLGACSRSDVAKQSEPAAVNEDASPSETTKNGMLPAGQPITEQQPGGPPIEVDANAPKPVDPSQLPMTPSNAPLPTPSMNAPGGAQQVGAPPSESPAGTPPGGVKTPTTVGRPVSEQPVGGMEGAGSSALKNAVEAMLRSQQGFGGVTVLIGSDGCIILAGKVATPEKKEEAAAHTRGVAQGGCVMNRIEVGK